MKVIYILFLFSVVLMACRSPKDTTADKRFKEQKDIENNISVSKTDQIDESVYKALSNFFNEKLSINIKNRVYDPEKPIDPETGKPPLKEETDIELNKETNETTRGSAQGKKVQTTAASLEDKSKDKSKIDNSEKTKTKTGFTFWEALGISVTTSLIIGLIIFLIAKFK